MNKIHFEWKKLKVLANKRKHGGSFDVAQTVFYDENAIQFDDPDHSQDENRFLMLGMSFKLRIWVVSHCERHGISSGLFRPERLLDMRSSITRRERCEIRI